MKLLNDLFSGPTNEHYELWRVMAAIAFLIGMGLVIYTVAWRGQIFDLEEFAWGVGVLLFGASGGTALKDFVSSKARKP